MEYFYSLALSTAPYEVPESIEAMVLSPTSAFIFWQNIDMSGSINLYPDGYHIYYNADITNVSFPLTYITLENLTPSTEYNVTVCAYTNAGLGPCDSVAFSTFPTGKIVLILISRF